MSVVLKRKFFLFPLVVLIFPLNLFAEFQGVKSSLSSEEGLEAKAIVSRASKDFCCDRMEKGGSFHQMSPQEIQDLLEPKKEENRSKKPVGKGQK